MICKKKNVLAWLEAKQNYCLEAEYFGSKKREKKVDVIEGVKY